MTKFLTAMTIIGLFAFKSFAGFGDLQNLAEAIAQFKQVITEMETIYNKGQIQGNVVVISKMNARTAEVLKYCQVIEAKFAQKAPDVLTRKQEARNRAIEKAESLLDASDVELRAAQVGLVRNLETTKYCLGLTSQLHTAIRASVSGGI
ncbi:MAG: hypothetical protein NDI63_04030 [Pseudobdellovibrio sp.]|nr:hypothetical protein [Pseudobdellovibrio sp.]